MHKAAWQQYLIPRDLKVLSYTYSNPRISGPLDSGLKDVYPVLKSQPLTDIWLLSPSSSDLAAIPPTVIAEFCRHDTFHCNVVVHGKQSKKCHFAHSARRQRKRQSLSVVCCFFLFITSGYKTGRGIPDEPENLAPNPPNVCVVCVYFFFVPLFNASVPWK